MPAGRPEKPIDLGKVRRLAARGLTQQQIATALGISRTTLKERKRKYPAFLAAVEKGQAQGIEKVSNALFERAIAGDVSAQIFYLKARAGWKDKMELSGASDNPIRHVISSQPLTPEQWAERYGKDE